MDEEYIPEWTKEITPTAPTANTYVPDWAKDLPLTGPAVEQEPLTEPAVEQEPLALKRADIINDSEKMGIIKQELLLRQGGADIAGKAARAGKSLLGASNLQLMGEETDEQIYDMWLENHRLLSAGQSTTLVNEMAFVARLKDPEKNTLSKGYGLFDSLQNVYTGDTDFWEKWEATKDYASAVVLDPTNFVSFGVGKAFTVGGTKAAVIALKASVTAGKGLAVKAVAKQGLKGAAADAAVKTMMDQALDGGIRVIGKAAAKKELGVQVATDFVLEVGKDALRQEKIQGVLDPNREYSYSQTAIAALGAVVLPATIYGAKGVAKVTSEAAGKIANKYQLTNIFEDYANVSLKATKMTVQEIRAEITGKLNKTQLSSSIGNSFDNFLKDRDSMLSWKAAKAEADQLIRDQGLKVDNSFEITDFYRRLFWGSATSSGQEIGEGIVHAFKREGIAVKFLDVDDKISNYMGDAISYIDNTTMRKILTDYQTTTGTNLGFNLNSKTLSKEVGSFWKVDSSRGGMTGNVNSLTSRILDKDLSLTDLAKLIAAKQNPVDHKGPAYGAWLLNVRNRGLTANPSTTAINLKGWAYMSGANSLADIVEGSLNYSAGKFLNNPELAMKGKGSLLGVSRRAYNVLNWDATVKEGLDLLENLPKAKEDLFRILSGDSGMNDPRAFYNIGDKNVAVNAIEGYVQGAQKVWGVGLQDEQTKLFSFVTNLDQALMKNFDTNLKGFMGDPKWQVQLRTEKFADAYEEALDRTLRETGSKSWTDKKGNGPALALAKKIEGFSNSPTFTGWVLPFGRWFNTSTAFMSDFTGASLAYNTSMRGIGVKKASEVDLVADAAKAAAFWGGVALFYGDAEKKLEEGTPWNIHVHDNGTREDITNQFPRNVFSFFSQFVAHAKKDGLSGVPKELNRDGFETLLFSAFKGTQNTIQDLKGIMDAFYDAEYGTAIVDLITKVVASNVSAVTRSLDPVNTAVLAFSDDLGNPDRRQGAKALNEAFRYLDGILKLPPVPERQDPTKGTAGMRDLGKNFSGFTTKNPVAVADRMLAAVGQQDWRVLKWQGDPMVKNRMDEILSTVINTVARDRLILHPDFFEKPIGKQQLIVQNMVKESKDIAKKLFESGLESKDRGLALLSKLNSFPDKRALERAKEALKLEDLAELLAEDGGVEMLEVLLATAQLEAKEQGF